MKNSVHASLLALGMFAFSSSTQAATIVFDFNNGTGFDTSGAGATMSATDGSETVVATTVDVFAPEYDGTPAPTGNTLSATGGDGVVTNILSSTNAIGINNPSISNTAFETGLGGPSGENGDFNLGESWVVEFDTTITITEFNLSSIGPGEVLDVTVEGVVGTYSFGDGTANDDFSDPLSGLVIPAGADITFTGAGTLAATAVRITEITVETIPEPSSLLLSLLGSSVLVFRRRR